MEHILDWDVEGRECGGIGCRIFGVWLAGWMDEKMGCRVFLSLAKQ